MVIDLSTVRDFNELRVFQMMSSDGKVTQLRMYYHADTNVAPIITDPNWLPLFPESPIADGVINVDTVSLPTIFSFGLTNARFLKIEAKNDGSLGNPSYTEIRELKLFNTNIISVPAPPDTIYTTSCFPLDTGITSHLFGCDSLVFTITSLDSSSYTTVYETSCLLADTGTTVQVLVNNNGCDSTLTTITSLLLSDSTTVYETSCLLADTGTTVQILVNNNGCDSVVSTVVALSSVITNVINGNQSICDQATNTYSQELIISVSSIPLSGFLTINGQNFTIITSPQTISMNNLNADGLPVNLTANFSGSNPCPFSLSNAFTAPADCSIPIYNITYTTTLNTSSVLIDGTLNSIFPITIPYLQGTNISLEAFLNSANFLFDFWGTNFSTFSPSIYDSIASFTVVSNDTIIANFIEKDYDTLWVVMNPVNSASLEVGNEIITSSPYMLLYPFGDIINIEAFPNQGSIFNQWELSGELFIDYNENTFFTFLGQDTLFAYFDNVLSVSNPSEDVLKCQVYPNVFNNKINIVIESKESTELEIKLVDFTGKLISSRNVSLKAFNTYLNTIEPQVSSGFYILNIRSKKSNISFKLIKID